MVERKRSLKDVYVMQKSGDVPHSIYSVCAMAVYKGDQLRWVRRAVESIVEQTVRADMLVIVVDGVVSDPVSEYLSRLPSENPKVVIFWGQENRGLSACMNFVIDWVLPLSPAYFFRMDADDISIPERFERQIALLERHSDVDILGSAIREIDENGNFVGTRRMPVRHETLKRSFCRRCPINHPSVVMRFRIFEQGFRYRDDLPNTQDYFFWVDLAAAGFKFANIKEPLLYFRRVNGFYKRRGRGKSLREFKARWYAMTKLKQHSLHNWCYATAVLFMRMMPAVLIKLAYKIDRKLLERFGRH